MDARRAVVLLCLTCLPGWSQDWPQLQGNPQRSGYTPDTVKPPFAVAWRHVFAPERVSPFVQAVVCQGQIVVGTLSGNVYAFDAKDGSVRWKSACGPTILHTAACADGLVVVGGLDGVHALKAESGAPVWRFVGKDRCGFSAAPLIAEGAVYIGERDGTFHALNLADGSPRWSFAPGAPIFNSAAYDAGKVFFCDERLVMHCLDAKTGAEIWASEQLYGQSAKGYCPVVVNGLVIFRPMATNPLYVPFWPVDEANRMQATKPADLKPDELPPVLMEAQDRMVAYFRKRPASQDLFILDERSGRQAFIAPHIPNVLCLPGGTSAPAWDGKHSILLPWTFGGWIAFWGRFDLNRQRFVEILIKAGGNPDETAAVSVGGDMVFIGDLGMPACHFNGAYDLAGKTYHVAAKDWTGCTANPYMIGGTNAVSIADGRCYNVAEHTLWAWTSGGGAKP